MSTDHEQAIAALEKAIADVRAGDTEAFDTLADTLDALGIDIDDADEILGDKVLGDSIDIGAISNARGIAIGRNIQMVVNESALPGELETRLNKLFDMLTHQPARWSNSRHIRVFISSPSDLAEERALAMEVIEDLPYDPLLRDRVTMEAVAWDKPDASTPLLATMTPQEAINQGLARPSDVDIVIVLFWSRMGTPLPRGYEKPPGYQFDPPNGMEPTRYFSGTEWEYIDAMESSSVDGLPMVVVYRRTEPISLTIDDPDFDSKRMQWQMVDAFFKSFINEDGSAQQGFNPYQSPAEFRKLFEVHLRDLVARLLVRMEEEQIEGEEARTEAVELWQGSPFPGLRSFTPADAPIFFGRGVETGEVLGRIRNNPFTAVIGASGSGKSSLVWSGVFPRLAEGAIDGSRDWLLLRMTPDEVGAGDPFASTAAMLIDDPIHAQSTRLSDRLREEPDLLARTLEEALPHSKDWAEGLLFIDQFEELFTRIDQADREPYVEMLAVAAAHPRIRIIVTLRADFYTRCVEIPQLSELIKSSTYPLAAPRRDALREMIERPAERAGLTFEPGLVTRILDDTGDNPGSLALLAFALQQLYEARDDNNRLTWESYNSFGGVKGAIGQQAQQAFDSLSGDAQIALPIVFRELVAVDERGTPTRRRAPLSLVTTDSNAAALVNELSDRRLLVRSRDEQNRPIVEVAHEALFTSWPRLAEWIETTGDDLSYGAQISRDALAWHEADLDASYLLRGTALEIALDWWERAEQLDIVNELQRDYIRESRAAQQRRAEAEEKRRQQEIVRLRAYIVILVVLTGIAIFLGFESQRNLRRAEEFLAEASARQTEVAQLIQLAAAREQDSAGLATRVAQLQPTQTFTPQAVVQITETVPAAAEVTATAGDADPGDVTAVPTDTPAPTATEDPIRAIRQAIVDFEEENMYMLSTGDTSRIDTVAINPELTDRLESAEVLRNAGYCVWSFEYRGLDLLEVVVIDDSTVDAQVRVDRDGDVLCDDVIQPQYSFTGVAFYTYTVQLVDGRWIVSDRRSLEETAS